MSNSNLFPTIIGEARIREYGTNGSFSSLECATNINMALNTAENTAELLCGSGDSVTLEKPTGNITLKVIKTKNTELIGNLLGLTVESKTGTQTITDQMAVFGEDDIIEMRERSNDGNGITSVVLKSQDGVTTYALGTDYTVAVSNNITKISIVSGGGISTGDTVLISGSIEQSDAKETSLQFKQRIKKMFEIEIFGMDEKGEKYTTVNMYPVVLDSEYIMEMHDAFRDGEIAGSDLTFKAQDQGTWMMRDEII